MKKMLMLVLALVSISSVVLAEKAYFIDKAKNKKVEVDSLDVDSSGTLSFKEGRITRKLKRDKYDFAYDPNPGPVKAAYGLYKKNDYKKAAEAFAEAFKKYRYVGWEAFCKLYEAECLEKAGDPAKAISVLQSWLRGYKPNRVEAKYYLRANKLLANLLIDAGKYDNAKTVLDTLENTKNDEAAGFAFNGRGRIMDKTGNKKEAVIQYLQTVILFKKDNEARPEAVYMVAKLLKEQSDARAVKFENMLKSEYPNSDYVKQLK